MTRIRSTAARRRSRLTASVSPIAGSVAITLVRTKGNLGTVAVAYATADGHLAVLVYTDKQWQQFAQIAPVPLNATSLIMPNNGIRCVRSMSRKAKWKQQSSGCLTL